MTYLLFIAPVIMGLAGLGIFVMARHGDRHDRHLRAGE